MAEHAGIDDQESRRRERLAEDISVHIFTVSAAMVGVCLTVIGLIRIVITIRKINTLADDLLAADALIFMLACICSYVALRKRPTRRLEGLERLADCAFIIGLLLMVAVCCFITYAIV